MFQMEMSSGIDIFVLKMTIFGNNHQNLHFAPNIKIMPKKLRLA